METGFPIEILKYASKIGIHYHTCARGVRPPTTSSRPKFPETYHQAAEGQLKKSKGDPYDFSIFSDKIIFYPIFFKFLPEILILLLFFHNFSG